MRVNPVFAVLLCVFIVASSNAHDFPMREGDIVFLASPPTDPVLLATRSQYGHVGMILKHRGELMFFEAVSPVKYTPLGSWVKKLEAQHFVVRRLKNADSILTRQILSRMDSAASTLEGKPYDSWYNWSDEKLYCSELVWKIYHRILGIELCDLRRLKSYDLTSPAVQNKLKDRFPDGVPLEEMVVSPQDIYESSLLTTVFRQ